MKTLFIIPGACSFGSMVALEWLQQPYQVGITTAEIRSGAEFRAINPLGKVGALKDGDNMIYENIAILLYLVDKNPDSKIAIPLNTPQRINAYKWLSYLSSTLHVAFSPLFNPSAFVDEADVEKFKLKMIGRLQGVLAYVDSYLKENEYFISTTPGIVDAQAYGLLRWAEKFNLLKQYNSVNNFIQRLGTLPAVRNALNIEQQQVDTLIDSGFAGYYVFK